MSNQDEHGGDLPVTTGKSTRYPGIGCSHCPASFFSYEGQHVHTLERHPDKPVAEEWESSEGHKVTYVPNPNRATPNMYVLSDSKSGKYLSNLVTGHEGEIQGIETHPDYRRQGHATELLNAAKEHAETTPGVPTPKFSPTRTSAGEKWQKKAASKLGGEVPPRGGALLSPRQMRGMLDFRNQ